MYKNLISSLVEKFSLLVDFSAKNRIPRIFVSDISSSIYCEWRKILESKFGFEATPEMERGLRIHNSLFPYEKIVPEEADKVLEAKGDLEITLKLGFIWEDFQINKKVLISGIPDRIFFESGRLKRISELKTRKNQDVYVSDIIQCGLYAICIERMLPDIVEIKDLELEIKVLNVVDQSMRSEIFFFRDLKQAVENTVSDIMDFWLGKREPKVSASKNLCSLCYFRTLCDKKLI